MSNLYLCKRCRNDYAVWPEDLCEHCRAEIDGTDDFYSQFLRQLTIDHATLPFMEDEPPIDPDDTADIRMLFDEEDED